MQSLLLISLAVFAGVSGSVRRGNCICLCTAEIFYGHNCCTIEGVTREFKGSFVKCGRKHYGKKRPTHLELKNANVCFAECVLSEEGLLTDNNTLDRQAITKLFTCSEDALRPVIDAALEKCFGSYEAEVNSRLECKSGAAEFSRCLSREGFLNCPASHWIPSPECEEMKVNVTKCPKIPVAMRPLREKLP